MEVQINTSPVEILTSTYQIGGELEVRGSPAIFINDSEFAAFTIHNATVTPLVAGTRIGALDTKTLYLPKDELQVLVIGGLTATQAQLLPHKVRMVCFTDTYVLRGFFHTGPETQAGDIFYSQPGPFFPATDVELFPLRSLSIEVGGAADLVYIHRDAVRLIYEGKP